MLISLLSKLALAMISGTKHFEPSHSSRSPLNLHYYNMASYSNSTSASHTSSHSRSTKPKLIQPSLPLTNPQLQPSIIPHSPRPPSLLPTRRTRIEPNIRPHTRRQIINMRPPRTLIFPQCENQLLAFQEKLMIDPILSVWFAVESGGLNVYRLVGWIEIDVSDHCRLACKRGFERNTLEERRNDEVNILSRVRTQPHHRKSEERAHSA